MPKEYIWAYRGKTDQFTGREGVRESILEFPAVTVLKILRVFSNNR